jgi:hypothetical protein
VAPLVGNEERDPSGIVMAMSQENDRTTIDHAGNSLKTRGGKEIDGNYGYAAVPEVLENMVESNRTSFRSKLLVPRQGIGWKFLRGGSRSTETANDGCSNSERGMNRGRQPVPVDVPHASKLCVFILREGKGAPGGLYCCEVGTKETSHAQFDFGQEILLLTEDIVPPIWEDGPAHEFLLEPGPG